MPLLRIYWLVFLGMISEAWEGARFYVTAIGYTIYLIVATPVKNIISTINPEILSVLAAVWLMGALLTV